MKVSLVCIAKDEDLYIDEWIQYHKKLGFDDIYIYQNDWRWSGESENVYKIEVDGPTKQKESYNNFIKHNRTNYDWVAFFDVDEFLVLKKHKDIKSFLTEYESFPAVGINWVLFGDNGHTNVNDEYSVLKRFTKRQENVDIHVKCIVKLNNNAYMNVHNPSSFWVDTHKQVNNGPFTKTPSDDIAQINHYFCKTQEEFELKCERGRADTNTKRNISDFNAHNHNEIEDLTAYNFFFL